MIDAFLFVGLPYLALATCLVGTVWRWRTNRFSISSLSSQFLENRQLLWGSAPWHIGILVVLLGHLAAFLLPGVWHSLMSRPAILLTVEATGLAAALLALVGLAMLFIRRLTSARVQAVTTSMDLVVLALLMFQVLLGVLSAVLYPYGAAWATGSLAPWLVGILTLAPDPAYVVDLPVIVRLHLIGAWLLLLALPFSRLVHLLVVPVQYLFRPPQIVVWNSPRHRAHARAAMAEARGRREFIKGAAGAGIAVTLMGVGVMDKLFNFFKGPRLEGEAEVGLLEKKLQRLKQAAEQRTLELERQKNNYILVARYADLQPDKGRYFTDYAMAPALAFKGADGLPLLISAKCTHLGCTVSNELDPQGRLLCPCHISYFDVRTGMPNPGAPAKDPLHAIGWTVMDSQGTVLATRVPGGPVTGEARPEQWAQCGVYIAKPPQSAV